VQRPHVLDELSELGFVEFGAAGGAEKRRQCSHHALIGCEVSRNFAPRQGRCIEEGLFLLSLKCEEARPFFEDCDVFGRRVDPTFQFCWDRRRSVRCIGAGSVPRQREGL
jgi:hypothetical protein